ncbi:hypothetical protein ACTU3I_07480 [Microbacterium sp. RD1]|uniref:hypothetical protein n=1 Tax=Microbacterium sp. RD1 TaxID=3457313 RepID=UPI003FA60132
MSSLRRGALALALALCGVLATGCAPGPSPEVVTDRARGLFDGLVGDLSAVDPGVLRSVEITPASEEACGDEEQPGVQTSFVATGTLSITAEDDAGRTILDALSDDLDDEEWDRIRTSEDGQDAWASEDGIVITTTLASPAIVVAVFTSCRA